MRRISNTAVNLIKLGVSLSLIAWLIARMDLHETWHLIRAFDARYLGPVLALSLCGILISVWKWSLLLKTVGPRPPFGRLLRLFWSGVFFNNFLPGRTGGDLVRAYGIARDAQNRIGAALSVAIDRGLNLAALLGIALIALVVSPGMLPDSLRLRLLYGGTALYGGALLALVIGLRLSRKLRGESRTRRISVQVSTTFTTLLRRPGLCVSTFALSALYQTTMILSNYGVARALGLEIAPGAFFYLIPLTALVTMIPIALNGLGLREGAYAVIFTQVGITAEAAVATSIAATLCTIGISLVGGILYFTGPIRIGNPLRTFSLKDTPHTVISTGDTR